MLGKVSKPAQIVLCLALCVLTVRYAIAAWDVYIVTTGLGGLEDRTKLISYLILISLILFILICAALVFRTLSRRAIGWRYCWACLPPSVILTAETLGFFRSEYYTFESLFDFVALVTLSVSPMLIAALLGVFSSNSRNVEADNPQSSLES